MKKNKFFSFLLTGALLFGIVPQTAAVAKDTAADSADYRYFLNTGEKSAYVELGKDIVGRDMEFIDGLVQGVTDKSDPLYNELVTLDGLDARKQYAENSFYFKISDDFYDKGDNEILFSVAFYDFGPGRGEFYLEYHSTDGTTKEKTLIKPGTKPGWYVRTVCIDDIDLSMKYENGASVRFKNRAYNAFRKVEAVNVSKARREKSVSDVTCLGNDVMLELDDLCILDIDDKDYKNSNLSKTVTANDVQKIINIITNNGSAKNNASKKENITQGKLLSMFSETAGIKKNVGESAVEAGMRTGIAKGGFFLYDDAPATVFNMLSAAYNTLISYETESGDSLLGKLIDGGYYDDKNVEEIENSEFKNRYHKDDGEYGYFTHTDENSAYVLFGKTIESKNIEFIDGQSLGITDSSDLLYNETVTLDGLDARKQYRANTSYFKISDEFYDKGDNEILFSIVFYDFGPGRGTYNFEYHSTNGTLKQVTLVKPGTNPGWAVRTVCVDDIDLSTKYDNGATVRIVNGAYNAFYKFEAVNISKARRENTSLDVTCLGNDVMLDFEDLKLMKIADERFQNKDLANPVNAYDLQDVINIITNNSSANTASKNQTMTQGELLTKLMNLIGVSRTGDETAVDAASRVGIAKGGFFISDLTPASNYNMLVAAYNTLCYETADGKMLIDDLISGGYYDNIDKSSITNDTFTLRYYMKPRYLPYTTITDPGTNRTYKYVNLFGSMLIRPYATMQSITLDGKSIVCGTQAGFVYLYNTETQMLYYIDKAVRCDTSLSAGVMGNGWIYYIKQGETTREVWRVHPDNLENKEHVIDLPVNVLPNLLSVTDDGKYMTVLLGSGDDFSRFGVPENAVPLPRFNLETGEAEWFWYDFPSDKNGNHQQINPKYPNLIGFTHEGWYNDARLNVAVSDRMNVFDIDTGEVYEFTQGSLGTEKKYGIGLWGCAHEFWSYDGEYRFSFGIGPEHENVETPVKYSAIARYDKDGTHLQIYDCDFLWGGTNHGQLSGDNKMFVADGSMVGLVSAETHQIFPIAEIEIQKEGRNHPYHPHPHAAHYQNIINWGHVYKNVLGIAWYDYTDILNLEVAEGGRYPMNDKVTRVSYKALECESAVTVKDGVECAYAKPNAQLFIDVNRDYLDSDNCKVKLTFDYYDNGRKPIEITYSKGVEEYNDLWKSYNMKALVQRTGTNKWKTAEIVLDCARLESVGKFDTDFKFKGVETNVYITNINVVRLDTSEDES